MTLIKFQETVLAEIKCNRFFPFPFTLNSMHNKFEVSVPAVPESRVAGISLCVCWGVDLGDRKRKCPSGPEI